MHCSALQHTLRYSPVVTHLGHPSTQSSNEWDELPNHSGYLQHSKYYTNVYYIEIIAIIQYKLVPFFAEIQRTLPCFARKPFIRRILKITQSDVQCFTRRYRKCSWNSQFSCSCCNHSQTSNSREILWCTDIQPWTYIYITRVGVLHSLVNVKPSDPKEYCFHKSMPRIDKNDWWCEMYKLLWVFVSDNDSKCTTTYMEKTSDFCHTTELCYRDSYNIHKSEWNQGSRAIDAGIMQSLSTGRAWGQS